MKIEISDLGKDAEGVAKQNGKIIFVPFCLPEEIVEAKAIKEKDNLVFAKKSKIIKKSPNRTIAKCPYFEKCGGCDLQHLTYDKQLEFKQNLLKNTIKKIAQLEINVEECEPCSNNLSYRNKIAIPVHFANEKNIIGLYEKNTHCIVEVEKCEITKSFNEKLFKILRQYLKKYPSECITHFVARKIDENLLLTIVSKSKNVVGIDYLIENLQKEFKRFGLNLNINASKEKILSNTFLHLFGIKNLQAQICETNIEVGSGSFYQVNDEIMEKLYKFITSNAKGDVCIDAYSGAGLLSALLAKSFKKVISVEIVRQATDNAKQMLKQNKVKNVEVICGKCEQELPKILAQCSADCIVLDPPRSGCDSALLEEILKHKIAQIIYVACSPQTLARDLKILKQNYEIEIVKPFDMFPQTKHVETVAMLKIKQN